MTDISLLFSWYPYLPRTLVTFLQSSVTLYNNDTLYAAFQIYIPFSKFPIYNISLFAIISQIQFRTTATSILSFFYFFEISNMILCFFRLFKKIIKETLYMRIYKWYNFFRMFILWFELEKFVRTYTCHILKSTLYQNHYLLSQAWLVIAISQITQDLL